MKSKLGRKKICLPVFELILFFGKIALELLELGIVLVNRLSLLVDLLLQCHRDLVHIVTMLIDPVFGAHDIFLEVLHAERPLVESNVERSYVTKVHEKSNNG